MKTIRIFLLVLIIIGVGLLFTQKIWVPKVVDYILQSEATTTLATPIVPTTKPTPKPSPIPVVRPGQIDSGVEGIVTIGPVCPVVRYPADPACADKAYETTLVIKGNLIGKSGGILVQSDTQGYFSQELIPGTYTISAVGDRVMPRLSPVTFEVVLHKRISLNLQFDSGIR